jgi:hypothetical protein
MHRHYWAKHELPAYEEDLKLEKPASMITNLRELYKFLTKYKSSNPHYKEKLRMIDKAVIAYQEHL